MKKEKVDGDELVMEARANGVMFVLRGCVRVDKVG